MDFAAASRFSVLVALAPPTALAHRHRPRGARRGAQPRPDRPARLRPPGGGGRRSRRGRHGRASSRPWRRTLRRGRALTTAAAACPGAACHGLPYRSVGVAEPERTGSTAARPRLGSVRQIGRVDVSRAAWFRRAQTEPWLRTWGGRPRALLGQRPCSRAIAVDRGPLQASGGGVRRHRRGIS